MEVLHPARLETILHRTYNHRKKRGEWFNLTKKNVKDFIEVCEKIEKNLNALKEAQNPYL